MEQAYSPFIGILRPFYPFRDAGFCINTFPITVLDVAKAMRKAKILNHFNFKQFSLQNYQNMAKLQNGDLSWIIPGKFIAFSGPQIKRRQVSPGVYTLLPEEYVPIFKNLGVTCIVRFNDKLYDRKVYLNNGIRHVDLFYEDGANPSETILQAFLQLCEQEKGAIAVHCKAGLGRTGTNIAAYMMKHYSYTAKEAIAWCRICRPGSVVGPQQQFLQSIESKMFHEGNVYRESHKLLLPKTLAAMSLKNGSATGDAQDAADPSATDASSTLGIGATPGATSPKSPVGSNYIHKGSPTRQSASMTVPKIAVNKQSTHEKAFLTESPSAGLLPPKLTSSLEGEISRSISTSSTVLI